MPGDLVVGDREGLTFIPPQVVEQVANQARITELHDNLTKAKLATGKYRASELYPSPSDEALKKEYMEWLRPETGARTRVAELQAIKGTHGNNPARAGR